MRQLIKVRLADGREAENSLIHYKKLQLVTKFVVTNIYQFYDKNLVI